MIFQVEHQICQWNSDEVRMWVFEETLPSGEKLTDVINRTNVSLS